MKEEKVKKMNEEKEENEEEMYINFLDEKYLIPAFWELGEEPPEHCFADDIEDFEAYIDFLKLKDDGDYLIRTYMKKNKDCYKEQKFWDYAYSMVNRYSGYALFYLGYEWPEDRINFELLQKDLEKTEDGLHIALAGVYWPKDKINHESLYKKILEIKSFWGIYTMGMLWDEDKVNYRELQKIVEDMGNAEYIYQIGQSWPSKFVDYKSLMRKLEEINNQEYIEKARKEWKEFLEQE